MSFEHKENSGSLFRNSYKTEEKHPDHQGDAKIVCPHCNTSTIHKISAWINDMKDGGKYFGLSFSLPKAKGSPVIAPDQQDFDDDIPF